MPKEEIQRLDWIGLDWIGLRGDMNALKNVALLFRGKVNS